MTICGRIVPTDVKARCVHERGHVGPCCPFDCDEQEITPAEQRVLDAINTWYTATRATEGDHNPAADSRRSVAHNHVLAALREYGAEQRAAGFAEGRIAMLPVMDTEGSNDR